MNTLSKRQFLSGIFLLSTSLLAHSVAVATCPPAPGPGQTVTTLSPCCDSGLAGHPCGVDPQRTDIHGGPLTVPSITITPDVGDPTKVHIGYVTGAMTVTTYGACIGTLCGAGPTYHWTPFQVDSVLSPGYSFYTKNYPSSAYIGGDPNYVDLTKVTANQCSINTTWAMGNDAHISLDDQTENINLGCLSMITKPSPVAAMKTCPASASPNGQGCQPGAPDPVDPYSGDYYYAEEDMTVPGVIPLNVVRAYTSSQSGFTGPFGVGTYLKGYNYKITVPLNGDGTVNTSANQQVQVDDGSGLLTTFTNGSSGGLTFTNTTDLGPAGASLVLSLDGSNYLSGAVYTTPDHIQFSFDANGRQSQIQDAHGNTVALSRDTSGNLVSASILGRSLTFFYNTAGLISSISDHTGRTVQYTYTASNQLQTVTNPATNVQTYTWDTANRVQTMEDGVGNLRLLNYYWPNGMIKQQSLKTGGSLTSSAIYKLDFPTTSTRKITDPNGNTQTFTYDSHGLLTAFTDGLNHTDTTTYSANLFNGGATSRYIEQTDALSHTTHVDLNTSNLPTTITDALSQNVGVTYDTTWPWKPASITNARGKTTSYSYDATTGDLTTLTDANGKTTTFTYNTRGQVLTVTNPLGKTTTYTYNTSGDLTSITDPLSHVINLGYDSLGRLTSYEDANSNTTTFAYNALNQLLTVTDPYSKTLVYTYDNDGNLKTAKDKLGNTTSYTYDRKNNLTQLSTPNSGSISYVYDKADRLTKIIDAVNNSQNFTYDAANRLTQNQVKAGSTTQVTYTYTYDNADRLSTIGDGSNTWTYGYDNINRLTSLISPQGTVGYTYNADNYRTKLTATSMTDVTYGYDDLDRLTSITQGTDVFGYGYDDNSRRTSLSRPNGVTTSYTYDDADRLTQLKHLKTGVVNDPYDYTYDNAGNILTESRDGGTRTYTYDYLNRLVQMDKTVAVSGETLPKKIEYTYDANGNITQRKDTDDLNNVTTTGFTYSGADKLTQMTPPVGSSITYTYNSNGALTSDTGSRSFTWNALQQLTSMTAGGVTTNFSYDPLGRRTGLTQGSLSKTFFYDGLDMLSDSANTYLNGAGIDAPLRVNNGSANSYYLGNQLGSITHLGDSSGTSTGNYQYLPYGAQLTSSSPVSGNPFTYTAREDDGTGLLYYRARYYDPTLQAFISQDPLGDAQRYVGGNPIGFVDPLGLDINLDLIPQDSASNIALSNNAKAIPIPANTYSVLVHGFNSGVAVNHKQITAEQLAAKIINDPAYQSGRPIMLLSCGTGATGFAQKLANILGVPVKAPNTLLWVMPGGKINVKPSMAVPSNFPWNGVRLTPDLNQPGRFYDYQPK